MGAVRTVVRVRQTRAVQEEHTRCAQHQPNRAVATYQGRPLARPDDDIEDQGLGFDLGTLMGRRQILRAIGIGAAGLGLAACSSNTESASTPAASTGASTTATTGEIPDDRRSVPR